MAENLGASFTIDVSQLKKGLQTANKLIRESESQFKAAAAGMQDWTKSQEGLEKKLQSLNEIADLQKKKVEALKSEYNRLISEGLDPSSDRAITLRTQINRETEALESSRQEINRQQTALQALQSSSDNAEEATQSLTQKVKDQQNQLKDLKQRYIDTAAAQGDSSEEAQDLARQISELSGELRDNQTRLREAETAADNFDQSLEDVGDEADATTRGGLSAFTVALGNLAANVISNLLGKMKELASQTIEVGQSFDSSMSQVGAISGASAEDMELLRDKAKEMGATTKFSASEASSAFQYMAMAGWKTSDMISGIDGILNLAAASGSDLATTSDIVTDALTAMGYSAKDAGHLADVMAAASSNANTNVEMMGQTFKYAAPVAGALGYNMEDTAVAIGLMANAGIKADQAGTSLRSIMTRLSAPPKECAVAMNELGISLTDSEGNMKTLDEVMQDLRAAFDGLNETEQTAYAKHIAGAEAMSGLLSIVNAAPADYEKLTRAVNSSGMTISSFEENAKKMGIPLDEFKTKLEEIGISNDWFSGSLQDTAGDADLWIDYMNEASKKGESVRKVMDEMGISVEDLQKAMDNADGAAKTMANTMIDNLGGDVTLAKSNLESFQLMIYEKLEPTLRKGVKAINKMIDVFKWIVKNGKPIAAAITGIATAVGTFLTIINRQAIITAFTTGLTAIKTAFTGLWAVLAANPIGLIVSAIAGLVAAFVLLWNKSEAFRNFWIGLWESIKSAWNNFQEAFQVGVDTIVEFFTSAWNDFQEAFQIGIDTIVGFFVSAWDNIKLAWSVAVEFFLGIWDSIQSVFTTVADFFSTVFTAAWEAIKSVWSVASSFFKKIWNGIKKIFAPVALIIGHIFKTAWTAVEIVWKLATAFFKWIWDGIVKIFTPAIEFFKNTFSKAWEAIKQIWNAVVGYFQKVWNGIKSIFGNVLEFFSTAFSGAWEAIKLVWDTVTAYFEGVWTGVKTVFAGVGEWFSEKFTAAKNKIVETWSSVTGFFGGLWSGIKTKFSDVGTWFKEKFKTAWDNIKAVFDLKTVKKFFGDLWDGIKDKFTSIGTGVGEAVGGAFKKAINWAIDTIEDTLNFLPDNVNGALQAITDFTGIELPLFPTVDLPRLAKGGVVKQATAAIIGEAGQEAVVPLEHNTEWIDKLADRIADKIGGAGVVVNQTNNYSQAHSRYEIYKSQQATAAAVKLALSR